MNKDVFNRRDLLKMMGVSAASVAALSFPSTTWALSQRASATLPESGISVYPFPLSQVSLLAGPFQDNMNRTLSYLSFVDPDRLLYTFRANVGLSTQGAAPCGGWEDPSVQLRGHSTGHLLSALAQAYANTGNTAYQSKGAYLVGELAKCQAASPAAGFHPGYLSAFPENFFDTLESGGTVWAPYYTLHKILAGLLDMYNLAGNSQALTVATGMGDWATWRTGRLSYSQMQACLQTEFGGMNEALVNLAVVTGNTTYLTTAQRFDHAAVYDPLAQNSDQLAGLHGNTQLAKMMGCIREYEFTGTQTYADIVTNFWDIVVHHHSYAIGGNTNHEFFYAPDQIASQLSSTTCECCNTYNLLKITRQLFFHNPSRADYMDWYEKALWNQILGQQDPGSAHGFVAYYTPLVGIRTYSNDYDNFTCDHGTGMESNTKYADSIYFSSGDSTLYVNLFIASQLNWTQKNMTVTQQTTFPQTNTSRLTITGSGTMTLQIRVPSWTNNQMQIRVNGTPQNVAVTPNTYATISRNWASGDVVDLTLPMSLWLEPAPDISSVQAVKYGPIVLSGAYGSTAVTTPPSLDPSSIQPTSTPLQYTAQSNNAVVTLIPFYSNHQNYAVYWNTGSVIIYHKIQNKHSGLLLGVQNMSTSPGGLAIQWDDNGTADHLWRLLDAGNGSCKIINQNSGLLLGIQNASTAAGAFALQWDDNGTSDHLWQIVDAGGGYSKIINQNSGLLLGVQNASTADGAQVLQWSDSGTDDHLWQISYKIKNKNSGLLLGVQNMSTSPGGLAIQWDDNGTADHLWWLLDAGNGSCKIINQNSGLLLGIQNASTAAGAFALQWDDNGTSDHLWQIVDAGGGYSKIINQNSGLLLGVQNASTADGAQVLQWSDSGTDDHLWQIG